MRAIGQGVLIVELGMIDKLTNKKYSCLLKQLKKKVLLLRITSP